ncbi:MAG: type IV pilus twitching motility protein PilT [Candidatus Brocadiaceae bacterium]|nr:type IV pilus twitching motility protein PilT [Candidatus Brocadiaceae bacterium]
MSMDISELLMFAKKEGASDLHLSSGEPPIIRVDGDIRKVDAPPMVKEDVHALLYDILNDRQRKVFEEKHELDLSFNYKGVGRFRVNVFVQSRGEAVVFRTIPDKIPSLESLGLPPIVKELTNRLRGLILVTGPTGSGKSTTLAAMVEYLNQRERLHIITIEDPIEFTYEPKNCLINQRELGPHTHSFAAALRAAMREDPDVILVGEMRDLETIGLAMTAVETGHLVFATLHTSGAARSVNRIVDVFPPSQQAQIRTVFSEAVTAVISQLLFKRKEGKGRVSAVEVMVGIPAIRNLIREGRGGQITATMQTSRQFGMQTMDFALVELYKKDLVEKETILPYLSGPEAMKSLMEPVEEEELV